MTVKRKGPTTFRKLAEEIMPTPKRKPVLSEKEVREMLGEAIHTGFRKASDHPSAHKIWKLIREMPNEEWSGIADWIAWSLFYAKNNKK